MALTFKSADSSHVNQVSYDPVKKQMQVQFHNGKVYTYHDVGLEHYNAFKDAKSHGEHLSKNIRDVFRYTKG